MTDRAQDTEAIRAARERLRRACEDGERLYRKRMHAEPTIADDNRIDGILTLDLPDALGAYDRLVARLEAAEQALGFYADPLTYFGVGVIGDEPTGGFMEDIDEVPWPDGGTNWKPGKRARAALAAAAPGETTINKPNEWTAHNIPGPEFEYRESAAPGETEQTP